MRLKIIITTLLVISTVSLWAQQYREDYVFDRGSSAKYSENPLFTAIVAGVSLPTYTEKSGDLEFSKSMGWGMGLVWGIDVGALEIVPEIWFRQNSYTMYNNVTRKTLSVVGNGVELPIMAAIKMGLMRLNLGVALSLMDNNMAHIEGKTDQIEIGRMRSTAGYLVGVSGIVAKRVVVDLRCTGSFASVGSAWYDASNDVIYDYGYYAFSLNVGYRF